MSLENRSENSVDEDVDKKEKPKFRIDTEIMDYHNTRRSEVRLLEKISKNKLSEEDHKIVYDFAVRRVEEIVKEQIQDLKEFRKQPPAEVTEEERRPEFYIDKMKNI